MDSLIQSRGTIEALERASYPEGDMPDNNLETHKSEVHENSQD